MKQPARIGAIFILIHLWLLSALFLARAEEVAPPNTATPPRLSLVEGQVSFWRTGAQDWAPAQPNTPLAAGDSMYTGPGSNAEFQVGPRAYVRVGEAAQLQISSIEPDYVQLKLTTGEASVDLRQLMPGHTVEVDTPNGAFTVEHVGYYRFNVDTQSTTLITRRGGNATLTDANGRTTRVNAAEEVVALGTDTPTLETYAAPELDTWDRWNYSRTDSLLDSMSARYVPSEVYGAADLDHSGSWRTVPDYGPVWVPDAVPAGWAPYSAGHWMYDPAFGWSWVDDAPWGWAPYHYGRWVYVNGFWGWAPGPIIAHPVYAPALVAWLGGVRISAGVGVGWVALGWGEPLVPWWGPRGFVGVPSWGGWGGPRIVNRTVINTTTVNVTNINVTNITYANTQVRNAVIATSSDRFGRGGHDYTRPSAEEVRSLHPAQRGIEIRPSATSLVPGEGRAVHPPQEVAERQVIATRTPHDSEAWLHQAGLSAPARVSPPPRVVSPSARAPIAEQHIAPQADKGLEQHAAWRAPDAPRAESPDRPALSEPVQSQASTAAAHAQDGRPQPAGAPEARVNAQPASQDASQRANRPAAVGALNHAGAAEHVQSPPSPPPVQAQQPGAEASTPPEQRVNAQPVTEPRSAGTNPPAAVERMRPPPPPGFNEWRGQQQSRPSEGPQPGGPHITASLQPSAPPSHPASRSEPSTGRAEQRNLPGEPAMKLRPSAATAGSTQQGQGVASHCKTAECR
jgi:uncharacterized protein DUF6600